MQNQPQFSQSQQPIMGDLIDQLPADNSVPSHNEIRIVDQLFQKKKGVFDKILANTKDILLMGGLYILFSLPQTDEMIKKIITPTQSSQFILVGVKAVLFMLLYFVIKNMYLVRKTTPK